MCSANLDRSPTAEKLFQGWKSSWEAKSAGILPASGRNSITQVLIDWADLILVMEPKHAQYIHSRFKCDRNKVRVLNVRDNYFADDPELILELQEKIAPILARDGAETSVG